MNGVVDRRGASTEVGAFLVDRRGTVLGFDSGMETLTGYRAAEIVGRRERLLAGVETGREGEDRPSARGDARLEEALGTGRTRLRILCKDGRVADVESEVTEAPSGAPILVRVLRVVGLSSRVEASRRSAGRDPLTGLLDRAAFLAELRDRIGRAAETGLPVALVLVDFDRFRRFNDRWGRREGDEVLRRLAGILRAEVRSEDLVGRLGDDEMGLILPGAGRGEARVVAARIRLLVERIPPADRSLTASFGSACCPADADRAEDLLARAGEALDMARRLGRNRVWCYQRHPRVSVRTPVYFDAEEPVLFGYTRDLSPSGLFVQTGTRIGVGMRCALAFPLPDLDGRVHVIGRVVRTVPAPSEDRVEGMGIEFERFSPEDRTAIESFLHARERAAVRMESGPFGVSGS
jgi:uncharacterized protein (TIGR02266 family)